jgi:acyl-CoA thioesterase FadM
MSDVGIEFRSELFYGDRLTAYVTAGEFTRAGFDIFYKLVKGQPEQIVALAKTGMTCYNYALKKVVSVPGNVQLKLTS